MYSNETRETARRSIKDKLLGLAYRGGLWRLGRELWKRSLTVVNYHRIDDVHRPGFDSFRPNVSADPETFSRQLEYLTRWFHVISMRELADWLDGRSELPAYAALITFDDGYMDNYTHAYPILRQHSLPALIFLTTDHIGTDAPFYWDLAGYCFVHTAKDCVSFPNGTERTWRNERERDAVTKSWTEVMKSLPEAQKQAYVQRLPEELGVTVPMGYFQSLMVSWDMVREMQAGGIEFGGHTLHHPILTRIPLGQARMEISGSKRRIEQETGRPVLGFAYPNGLETDLNGDMESAVKEAGYRAAFTLLNGPAALSEVRKDPYAIRRIFVSHRHGMGEFALMMSMWNRVRGK